MWRGTEGVPHYFTGTPFDIWYLKFWKYHLTCYTTKETKTKSEACILEHSIPPWNFWMGMIPTRGILACTPISEINSSTSRIPLSTVLTSNNQKVRSLKLHGTPEISLPHWYFWLAMRLSLRYTYTSQKRSKSQHASLRLEVYLRVVVSVGVVVPQNYEHDMGTDDMIRRLVWKVWLPIDTLLAQNLCGAKMGVRYPTCQWVPGWGIGVPNQKWKPCFYLDNLVLTCR